MYPIDHLANLNVAPSIGDLVGGVPITSMPVTENNVEVVVVPGADEFLGTGPVGVVLARGVHSLVLPEITGSESIAGHDLNCCIGSE